MDNLWSPFEQPSFPTFLFVRVYLYYSYTEQNDFVIHT